MDKVKKIILFRIPMSICNFRCGYCYLAQRPEHYQGIQPEMKYTPEEVAKALNPKRWGGGKAYINFCADGETLLVKNIEKYIYELAKVGHYIEIVTNMTISKKIDEIIMWPQHILQHLEFKCSFHYLELKKRNLLNDFVENIHKVHLAGASVNIEITPCDELLPYLDEVKEFSLKNFGALPHLSIARNDQTEKIEYLTSLKMDEYDEIWGAFNSSFWRYKKLIFGKKQTEFCYAGAWSVYADLSSGEASQCYCGINIGNIFEHPEKPFPTLAIGKCKLAHCYNGHALLTLGLIPHANNTFYGDIRDRTMLNGDTWLQTDLKKFFNTKLEESNVCYTKDQQRIIFFKNIFLRLKNKMGRMKEILEGEK